MPPVLLNGRQNAGGCSSATMRLFFHKGELAQHGAAKAPEIPHFLGPPVEQQVERVGKNQTYHRPQQQVEKAVARQQETEPVGQCQLLREQNAVFQ